MKKTLDLILEVVRHETEKKTNCDSQEQDFQALVATESYEVGTQSPHVHEIFRVGVMRNSSVVVQEFGRVGRSGNNTDGINNEDNKTLF